MNIDLTATHLELPGPEDTFAFGVSLGRACTGGEVLLLSGDLGAGKTCLTQGVAEGLGVSPDVAVTSPTFVLHCQYTGRLELNHIDLYRLGTEIDWEHLGFDDFLGAPHSVTSIEWADFLGRNMPHEHLGIHMEIASESVRTVRLTARGPDHQRLLSRLDDPRPTESDPSS